MQPWCEKMSKYYRAILWEVARVYDIDSDDLHEKLKVWYVVETTTKLDKSQRMRYLEQAREFVMVVFDMYFDSDWYKNEWISWCWMFGSHKPDLYYSLRWEEKPLFIFDENGEYIKRKEQRTETNSES